MIANEQRNFVRFVTCRGWLTSLSLALALTGCASMGASGPTTRSVLQSEDSGRALAAGIKIIVLDDIVAQRVSAAVKANTLADALGDGVAFGAVVGQGDVLDISLWEAPPAALYGSAGGDSRLTSSGSTARGTSIPDQMVDPNGLITVPFAGEIRAAGRTPPQIERDIMIRLQGIAHQPQAIVRVVRNSSATVTVVGEVASSTRVPLTSKGERLLDILASAGGVRQSVGKTTIQITRGSKTASLPLDRIIRDPRQNIRLQPDDIVTALFQPFSFTALGAIGNNAEIPFEGTGVSLAQALGRIGGLRDDRADVRGVFIFRLEDPSALDETQRSAARLTQDGKAPVIYRVDMKNPMTFFAAQNFPIRNHDVIYVSNAPVADLQKFVNIVSSMAFSIVGISNSL